MNLASFTMRAALWSLFCAACLLDPRRARADEPLTIAESAPRATAPTGVAPATAPTGVAPATAPTGIAPATAPTGIAPATAPTGIAPATAPTGSAPATPPTGIAPATAPTGSAPATPQLGAPSSLAAADGAGALAVPPAGVAPRRAEDRAAPSASDEPVWGGPRVELGYVNYVLDDGFDAGVVHAVSFGGYLPTGQLRLGLIGDGGARDYALGGGDAVLRATLVAGWQGVGLMDYVLPYIAAVASCGVVVGQRFATTFADPLLGLGLEIGFEVNPVRTLHFGAALAHVRADVGGLGYGLWVVRLFVGL